MNCTPFSITLLLLKLMLGCGLPISLRYSSRFYHTTSHYLCHQLCYHADLVERTLGCSRNLMVYSRRFTPTNKPEEISHLTSFDLTLIRIAHTKNPTITSNSYHLLINNKRANLLRILLSACDE